MKSGVGMNIRNSDKWKRKLRDKATYERGKKAYGMAKKKQLKGARDHFSVADGRPTMAINVFEVSGCTGSRIVNRGSWLSNLLLCIFKFDFA